MLSNNKNKHLLKLAFTGCGAAQRGTLYICSRAPQKPSVVCADLRRREKSHCKPGSLQTSRRWNKKPQTEPQMLPRSDRLELDLLLRSKQPLGVAGRGGRGRACASKGQWSLGPDLHHLPLHLQSLGGLAPKIDGWVFQQGKQSHPHPVWPDRAGGWSLVLLIRKLARLRNCYSLPEMLPQ